MTTVFTIGYQESTLDAVRETLAAVGVRLLADVRAVTASRRPGFSKRQLRAGLAAGGIDYLHLRDLGTPAEGRLAARTGRYEDLRRIYEEHLATPAAQAELEELVRLAASDRPICLLCFERRPEHCHRRILAERLRERLGVEIVDLLP
ncbi:DUF488 family protein [Benzoatithermus flavus]|uniref:DUF488 domain-containing protein n=1 Tax=Benzoatithermus flavus TaxID=3108223 RepID=A0ABU8XRI2_9PROT